MPTLTTLPLLFLTTLNLAEATNNCQDSSETCEAFSLLSAKKFHPDFVNHEDLFQQGLEFRMNRRLLQDSVNATTTSISSDMNDEVFDAFVAHKDTMTCTADEHTKPFNTQVRGVCLGGWQVLEPWITPSL